MLGWEEEAIVSVTCILVGNYSPKGRNTLSITTGDPNEDSDMRVTKC